MSKPKLKIIPRCFRCGRDVENWNHGGQVTISGFYDSYSPAYYNHVTLCPDCHYELRRITECYLYEKFDIDDRDEFGDVKRHGN